jgi:YVTN family beta-propeller protein
VLDTNTLTISGLLNTGPITNHVTTVDLPTGKVAYVSVGGEDVVKV